MTAYYLLSAEPDAEDRDGRPHRIKVAVNRKDVNIRARREFTLRKDAAVPPSPAQRLAAVLQQPLLATELPIKVATYNLRTPGASTVKVVVTTEFGRNATAVEDATVAYVVLTDKGKVAGTSLTVNKAAPVRITAAGSAAGDHHHRGAPGTVRAAAGGARCQRTRRQRRASARRRAVVDRRPGNRRPAAGAGQRRHMSRPCVWSRTPTIEDEPFGAYLELYPGSAELMRHAKVTIEIAESETAPAIASTEAARRRDAGEGPLRRPGDAAAGPGAARRVPRARGGRVRRRHHRADAPVPSGARGARGPDVQDGLVGARRRLPARPGPDAGAAGAGHRRRHASWPRRRPRRRSRAWPIEVAAGRLETLDLAALGDDASITAVFLRGLAQYRAGKLEDAAKEFRAAVRQSSDFLPGIFYLGACYAAGGRGREAVGAWQTSLVGDDSSPDVFQLLIDGFLRIGDTDAAIGAIEEAAAKWPEDYRFVRAGDAGAGSAGQASRGAGTAAALAGQADRRPRKRSTWRCGSRWRTWPRGPSGEEQERHRAVERSYGAIRTPAARRCRRSRRAGSPTWPRARRPNSHGRHCSRTRAYSS